MNPPFKRATVLAKVLLLLSLVYVVSIFLISGTVGTGIAQSEEREFEDTTPQHLPIKVKIKKEKEKAFKDLKNEKWARDLEIEVTNIGAKPIYFLDLELIPEGVKSSSGYPIGFPLRYGRMELGDFTAPILPEDVPIQP